MQWKSLCLVVAALAVCGVAIALAVAKPSINAHSSLLNQLHAACVVNMVANTCKVMGVATPVHVSKPAAKPGGLVFIAGVGAIAAVDYQKMYEAGDAMCDVVREACAVNWASGRCIAARKLLLPPPT